MSTAYLQRVFSVFTDAGADGDYGARTRRDALSSGHIVISSNNYISAITVG